MYLSGAAPLPAEYHFLAARRPVRATLPDDLEERVLARRRLRERAPHRPGRRRRSTARGTGRQRRSPPRQQPLRRVNLIVDEASSTAEIVRDILGALDVALTPEIAEALYVGLVTDTGRFQYTNTTPKALRLAAELVEAGAERARHLPARLRDGAVREAEAARARARARPALRGRPARRLVPAPRRLRARSARRSRTPRASSTPCGPSRAPRWWP